MDNDSVAVPRWVAAAFSLLVIAWCVYLVTSAITGISGTSRLAVKSTNKSATLSITQDKKNAEMIGVGSKNIRLAPGTYQLSANYNGKQVVSSVVIRSGQNSGVNLDFAKAFGVPSIENVNFRGFDYLMGLGLSTDQTNSLKTDLFTYKPTEESVTVKTASVRIEPHDPTSNDPWAIDFNLDVDGQALKARITYFGIENPELVLRQLASNGVVFSSR